MKLPKYHPKNVAKKAKHTAATMLGTSVVTDHLPVVSTFSVVLVVCSGILAIYTEEIAHWLEGVDEHDHY